YLLRLDTVCAGRFFETWLLTRRAWWRFIAFLVSASLYWMRIEAGINPRRTTYGLAISANR
ncbi:MAG TPA: hypothetical protein PL064_00800, partial [Thermogutta sp.]|nr:hypothetical protein [Thermogutta sp.]